MLTLKVTLTEGRGSLTKGRGGHCSNGNSDRLGRQFNQTDRLGGTGEKGNTNDKKRR